jgi:hypothetical protein
MDEVFELIALVGLLEDLYPPITMWIVGELTTQRSTLSFEQIDGVTSIPSRVD